MIEYIKIVGNRCIKVEPREPNTYNIVFGLLITGDVGTPNNYVTGRILSQTKEQQRRGLYSTSGCWSWASEYTLEDHIKEAIEFVDYTLWQINRLDKSGKT